MPAQHPTCASRPEYLQERSFATLVFIHENGELSEYFCLIRNSALSSPALAGHLNYMRIDIKHPEVVGHDGFHTVLPLPIKQ